MKFEVETGQVNTMYQSFKDALGQINNNKQRMYQALESLDGTWRGPAHDAFVTQYQADHEKMTELLQELEQVAENISKARQDYDTCEQQVKAAIAAIQI